MRNPASARKNVLLKLEVQLKDTNNNYSIAEYFIGTQVCNNAIV